MPQQFHARVALAGWLAGLDESWIKRERGGEESNNTLRAHLISLSLSARKRTTALRGKPSFRFYNRLRERPAACNSLCDTKTLSKQL